MSIYKYYKVFTSDEIKGQVKSYGRKKTKIELFEELAQVDENGCSRWVDVTEFVEEYQELQLLNGAGWSRDDGAFGRKYIIERDKTITAGNKTDAIRTVGFNKGNNKDYSQNIRSDIKNEISSRKCVVLGTSKPECDHKNGRKNDDRVMKNENQQLSDFQPLSKAANDAKRQFCKECRQSGKRFDAKTLGYPMSYYEGGEEHNGQPDGCEGCFWYD
ncbi:MAG: hypothetical protein K2J40_05380, partial [Ruminococcus sp.]|nr:hypothetical protein [Ruminococcus sp.]